jgi:hypothetical protein
VHPASFEHYGRLSQRFHSLLIELDAIATQHAIARGLHAARFYRRWLTLINVALNKCLCRVFEETVCPHSKPIPDALAPVSHKHLIPPPTNRDDPPPPDLHLASPRHIPSRLRQRPTSERPAHQPPTPPDFLGESSPDPSSAATSPRSGTITPKHQTAQNYDIYSNEQTDNDDNDDNISVQTQDATEHDILTMLSQPQSQTETNDGQYFNYPFSFGAPPFSTTPLDTPQSEFGTPYTQQWFHPVQTGTFANTTTSLSRPNFEALPESSSSSLRGSATQTKSSPQGRPANLIMQVETPVYYQPLPTQPIPPGDDSIDFGVAFDNTNSDVGVAITDFEAVNTQTSSTSTSRRECQ